MCGPMVVPHLSRRRMRVHVALDRAVCTLSLEEEEEEQHRRKSSRHRRRRWSVTPPPGVPGGGCPPVALARPPDAVEQSPFALVLVMVNITSINRRQKSASKRRLQRSSESNGVHSKTILQSSGHKSGRGISVGRKLLNNVRRRDSTTQYLLPPPAAFFPASQAQ